MNQYIKTVLFIIVGVLICQLTTFKYKTIDNTNKVHFSNRINTYKIAIFKTQADKKLISSEIYDNLLDGCVGSDFIIVEGILDNDNTILISKCRERKK